ncbi:hypothetical protein QYE76_046470 [Lolium multiflorum]|uniref:Reverse transcriptase domain-containing protein n=1 Tax=Lolium multiflorum TaxID=4521 RepID=A0AAD8WYE1_LOLMU|nr:hypothetical protein QYE76_046470 [Lolium multiflorum]
MSITLGEATKLLDNMMINYSEWHTERAPQGKKVNSVEETSSLSDKIDAIMSMLVNDRTNIDPNNVPLASLVAQEEHVDVNYIKNNNFNNNAYRNNSSNNYRPYPYNNGNGYGNSYGNSYNNNRNTPPGLEAMLKEFISTQTAFNKSVEEKLGKIDILASKVDSLAADVDLLKLKVMPNGDNENKIVTTANAIQVRINENIRLMVELHARWEREENEKLAKENNVAKVWTITTTSNANATHVAAPPTNNGKRIGVSNVSTSNAKREKLPKTAETACDKTAEIFSNIGDNDPIALDHNGLYFDDCHISEVIKFLQKLAKSPNASAINLAFTKHITNALIKAREEKLNREASIPRKLEDGWEPIIKMKVNDFDCNALCDLGASISVMPKKIYNMLDLPPLKNCYLDVNLADNSTKKPLGKVDNVRIMVNNNLVPVDFAVLDIECNASCPIILGRPFLRTVGATIDMKEAELPNDDFRVEQLASIALAPNNPLQQHLEDHESEVFREERNELDEIFLRQPILKHDLPVEDLGTTPPPKEDPVFDLKPLPDNLKYAYIDDKKTYPVIISAKLSDFEEERLLEILKKHRGAIGYTLDDLKGISPSICQHAINMEDDAKPVVEHQRRLIPKMKDVVRNEVLKLLEAGIIYPIADSRWVSPVHCVPKKGGITVVPNDNDELIPQRVVVGPRGKGSGATRRRHNRRHGQAQAARPWRVGPSCGPRLPFRLLKASVAKPPREPRYGKPETPPPNPISGIQEIASGTLPERGFISRGLYTAMVASGLMSE